MKTGTFELWVYWIQLVQPRRGDVCLGAVDGCEHGERANHLDVEVHVVVLVFEMLFETRRPRVRFKG